MIRLMLSRLTEKVRTWRHVLFKISRPILTIKAITRYQINYANQLMARGEYDEAIAILDENIDSSPGFPIPLSYAMRGLLHELTLRHGKALADFNKAINLSEVYEIEVEVNLYLSRGRTWAALREYERAVDDFNIAIELEPSAEAYSERGEAFAAMGKYIAAMDDCDRVIKRQPDADAYVARGSVYLCLNLLDDALKDFNRATQIDPTKVAPYGMRGRIHLQRGDDGAAAEEFTQILALMADIVDVDLFKFIDTDVKSRLYALAVQDVGSAYCGRGISKSRIGNNTGALSDFNAAIKIMPEHGSFYLARAAAYAEREEHAKAMQDLEVAIQLDGQNAEIHCMKAWVHFSEEEFSAALEEYSRTIELSPHWAAVY